MGSLVYADEIVSYAWSGQELAREIIELDGITVLGTKRYAHQKRHVAMRFPGE